MAPSRCLTVSAAKRPGTILCAELGVEMRDPTLNEVLALLGYTTAPELYGAKHIIRDGFTAFVGNAGAVWKWLRKSGQYTADQCDHERNGNYPCLLRVGHTGPHETTTW